MSSIFPHHYGSTTVRVIVQDGAPWFLLDDIRSAVGVDPRRNVADSLDDGDKTVAEVDTPEAWPHVAVVNLPGLRAVAAFGERARAAPFERWIADEALPLLLRSSGTATVLPPRPPGRMHSTSEIADGLGVHASALGRRVSHLKTEGHGEWRPAVGAASEAVVDRWWWNGAGRDAVLREFGARDAGVGR